MGEMVSRRQVLAGVAMLPLIAAVGCTDRAERPSPAQTTNTLLIRGANLGTTYGASLHEELDLLVDGDPTRRITDTRNINAVWKNGYPVS
jgi:hypothetical protein